MSESLFPYLTEADVSYVKLQELQQRLLKATRAGFVSWERSGSDFEWAAPSGVVDLTPRGIRVWDDHGNLQREFRPDTDDLYSAAAAWHEEMVLNVIDRILVSLDSIEDER